MLSIMVANDSITTFTLLLRKMKAFEQRKYLNTIISVISKHYFSTIDDRTESSLVKNSPVISGVAALVDELISDSDALKEHLVTSLTRSGIPALDDCLPARRSVIAALRRDEGIVAVRGTVNVDVNTS